MCLSVLISPSKKYFKFILKSNQNLQKVEYLFNNGLLNVRNLNKKKLPASAEAAPDGLMVPNIYKAQVPHLCINPLQYISYLENNFSYL